MNKTVINFVCIVYDKLLVVIYESAHIFENNVVVWYVWVSAVDGVRPRECGWECGYHSC